MIKHELYPKAVSAVELKHNLDEIHHRINQACARAGRNPNSVRLLPVSKTVDEQHIRMAFSLGCHQFGENKVQEAMWKAEAMQDLAAEWSIIGHLQTNKIKYIARFASEFQALDSLNVAQELHTRLEQENRTLDVFVQINTSGESSKYGLHPDQADDFIHNIAHLKRLKGRGLMTQALLSDESDKVRNCFILLRNIRNRLRDNLPEGMSMDELSMGMSGDFEMAIEEGASIVRIGQAIFGARALPDSYYWPEE